MTVGIQSSEVISIRCGRIRIKRDPSEPFLRVPDDILKCVGYVCEVTHEDATESFGDAYATGFFVSIPCESEDLQNMRMFYFVTAKHVALDLKDRPIFFTANKRGGGITHQFAIQEARWSFHPTHPNADVAVIQVGIPANADLTTVPVGHFGLGNRMKDWNFGIGDDIHIVGLFSAVPGNSMNTPIVRCGNIAMMPPEPIQTELGYTHAYLVEARSIGGMSGSPVFVRGTLKQTIKTTRNNSPVTVFYSGTGETLLGMIQGHWDIREEEINKPSFTHDRKRGVNYGIAVVVPAQMIFEAIYQPDLVAMRIKQEEKIMKRTVPGSDSARPKDKTSPFTKPDFEAALKKASRKIQPKGTR